MAKFCLNCSALSVIFILGSAIFIPTLSQNQNNRQILGGNPNIPGFTPFIVNSEPPQQLPQGQRFQQPPQNNQQFQQQQPLNNQVQQQQPQPDANVESKGMSDSCLACICQASTSCQLSTPCMNDGQYCGPFLLSKPYWIDSGKPTLIDDNADRDGAFQDCATDPICAAQVVRKYMNKFQKDCAGDGKIDCDDLARIHLMGPFDCGNQNVATTVFYRKFQQCWSRVQQLSE